MRNVPAALQSYMQGNATQCCLIVKVGPFPDDTYQHFADLDADVVYDGDTYKARTGVQLSALVTTSDLQVDNTEMDSLPPVAGHEIEGFTIAQIRAGAIDGIAFVTYLVNYTDTSKGAAIWAGGTIGEVRVKGTALINFEGRSISNRFNQNILESGSTTCRVKHFGSVAIGDGGGTIPEERQPCLYDASVEWVSFTVTAVDGADGDRLFATDLTAADDYFAPGKVRMTTGANAGLEREIEFYTNADGTVGLSYAFPNDMAVDDVGEASRECTRHYIGHNSCDTFHGTDRPIRFRGEPFKPVGDAGQILVPGAGSPIDVGGTGEDYHPPVVPTPTPGGNGTPGTPTARDINEAVEVTPTLTAGSSAAASNSTAINNAIATMTGGGVLVIPAGEWWINTANPITINKDRLRLDLETNNATLRAAHSTTVTSPSTHRDVVKVDGAEEWEIVGGRIIGYLDSWVAGGGASVYGISEWAHGIYVTNSATAGTVKSISITKCVGDGLSIGKSVSDIYVDDYVASDCRRQGISTGGDDITIDGFDISYIGTTSPPANGPWAGIDVEVDSPDSATNITIKNGRTHHNKGPGILAVVRTSNITVQNVTSDYNQNYGMLCSNSDTGTITGCAFEHNKYEGVKLSNDSDGWTIGGSGALKNRFFNNMTSLHGVITAGGVTELNGESSKTDDHINISSDSASTAVTNDFGP